MPPPPPIALNPPTANWMVAGDGGIFTFGDAGFGGSAGGLPHAATIAVADRSSGGYLLASQDGGVYSF